MTRRLIVAVAATAATWVLLPALAMAQPTTRAECAQPANPHHYRCFALVRTDIKPMTEKRALATGQAIPAGHGYTPIQLQTAYNLISAAKNDGGGVTVAVIDAYNDPNAAANLATYRAAAGLPPCTEASGCFQQLNQNGATAPLPVDAGSLSDGSSDGWGGEESLDVDMVSAICPNCHIDLVEANSTSDADLDGAANEGATLAGYESNSFGGEEDPGNTLEDPDYNHKGVVVTASAGDDGFGVNYPASSPYVTAVGGTELLPAANTRGWTETVWGPDNGFGTGSGCSVWETAKPSWQTDSTGCSHRTVADVAADADPDTGVAVYDTFADGGQGDADGWQEVGGTSASSPMIAAVYALAGTPAANTYPSSYPYQDTASLNDVTSGTNSDVGCSPAYWCTGEVGYDGPTGLGTPDGVGAFSSTPGTAPPPIKPPTATIASPASGGTYTVGQVVPTSFACAEGAGGPGLQSCNDSGGVATTAGGSGHLDTTTAGAHTYFVTATSLGGRTATTTISYTVAGASPPAPSADLSVKLGGAKRVTDGKTFTETITVTNHGPSAATALRATMSIPGAATVAHTGGTRNHGLVHWTDATLAAGRKAHFTVTFRAGRHANRRVTIQASVSDRVSDPDLTDNVAEAGVRLHPKPKPKHRRHKPKHHKPGLVSAQG